MERIPVTSSNLRAIAYDTTQRTLEVEFHNGKVWQYAPVAESIFLEILTSDSVGRSFNGLVKCDPNVVPTDVTDAQEVA